MSRRGLLFILALCLAGCARISAAAPKAQTLTAEQARDHIGETATVCGRVASTHFASRSRGRATFLNFVHPYPHQIFTAVIWGSDRAKFGQPEKQYLARRICVTGFISIYRGQPNMTLRAPIQISLK